MSNLLTSITTGMTTFTATNIDDLVILTLFYSQLNQTLRSRHIVIGQYLGFTALVLASLPGFFGSCIIPHDWIRFLGLMPIIIGLNSIFKPNDDDAEVDNLQDNQTLSLGKISSFIAPQTCNVAAVAFANGSDNISVYVPLFANSQLDSLLVIIAVFFILVSVWCYAAYKATNLPIIAQFLSEYGNNFVPCVLIGLGVSIVWENVIYTLFSILVSYLLSLTVNLYNQNSPAAQKIKSIY